jgi:hypothetical protein
MTTFTESPFLGLQAFHVAFLLFHDWVPLGRFNDIRAQRTTDPVRKRVLTTALSALPYLLLFGFSIRDVRLHRLSHTLIFWLWVGYGTLFAGELKAWWIPYFLRPDPERAARYRRLFGETHAFLKERNGIQPNTLHVFLHATTLGMLLLLLLL